MMKSLKRMRSQVEISDMAKCLMALSHCYSHGGDAIEAKPISSYRPPTFECKTCNRRFSSFQALGGHRASHKKPRLAADHKDDHHADTSSSSANNNKKHECSICGVVFSMGQALGGHMRRHRAVITEAHSEAPVVLLRRSNSFVKKAWLDLNLTPLENDLKLLFATTKLDHFIS